MLARACRACALAGCLIWLLGGCGPQQAHPIAIAAHVWPGYEPMFLAEREGWLDPTHVELVPTANAVDSLQALKAGRVDGAALTLDEVLRAREEGLALSVVLVFDISAGSDQLVARPEIASLADLRGRCIGFEQGALGELMLTESLRAAGLSRDDVMLMPLAVNRQPEAWDAGEVDACVTYEPIASQLIDRDAQRLFDSRQIPETIVDVLALRTEVLDRTHRDALRALVKAHFSALDYLHRNPQDAAYRMAEHMGLPVTAVLPAFKGLLLPDAQHNRRLLAGAEPPLLLTARRISALLAEAGLLEGRDDWAELIRADFLPASSWSP